MPHPDVPEFFAGRMLAERKGQGDHLVLVIVIHGACASFEAMPARLTEMRQAEAKRAALVLRESEVVWLGHPDFGLDRLGPGVLPKAYVRLIRPHRPQIAVTLDTANPGEIHPDHRAFARAAAEAVSCTHLPPVHPEQTQAGLHPHFVREQRFAVSGPGRGNRFVDVMATLDRKPAALPVRYSAYLQRRGLT